MKFKKLTYSPKIPTLTLTMIEEKEYTLVFVFKGEEVLLGMKKRGFGVGKWNGFGGKIEKGETNEEGAKRELHEESSLIANTLQRVGYLVFNMKESAKLMKVHVYRTDDFSGSPMESEEMKPKWYSVDNIPYDGMWPDDKYWIPYMLDGKTLIGRFDYEDDDTISDYTVKEQG